MPQVDEEDVTESTTVVATDEQLSTTIDGEAVILQLESGRYYGFNEVASRIWELVQEPRTIGEVRDEVLSTYDVSSDRCTQDVRSILSEMAAADLIEIDPDGDGGA